MADRNSDTKTALNQKFTETGEKERLKELLKKRLCECGWRDALKESAKGVISERGTNNTTVDELVTEITPKGRDLIPDVVKKELLSEIRKFLSENSQG